MSTRRELRRLAVQHHPHGPTYGVRVCAMEDYNALGLVYFANYPRLLDRVERLYRFGDDHAYTSILEPVRSRRCLYYGNADGGDELLADVREDPHGRVIHLRQKSGELLCISSVVRTATATRCKLSPGGATPATA